MISASAPAKAILFGEHAVVYGQPAIAAPISSLRVTAFVEMNDRSGGGVRIAENDLGTALPINVESAVVDEALTLTIRLVLEALRAAPPACRVTIHSQIPVASGLGSGAAVAAAVARALSTALGSQLDNKTLNQLVYQVEQLHHGTPSGIDNTVIVYERPVYFVRGQPIEFLTIGKPFSLLIADSGCAALTRTVVADVRSLYETDPAHIQPILDSIGKIAVEARKVIEGGDAETVGRLMIENHALLQELTVSSPELDRLVDAALSTGALGAKLSGGGRGGNMIALVTSDTSSTVADALLQAGAARVFHTVVGGES